MPLVRRVRFQWWQTDIRPSLLSCAGRLIHSSSDPDPPKRALEMSCQNKKQGDAAALSLQTHFRNSTTAQPPVLIIYTWNALTWTLSIHGL